MNMVFEVQLPRIVTKALKVVRRKQSRNVVRGLKSLSILFPACRPISTRLGSTANHSLHNANQPPRLPHDSQARHFTSSLCHCHHTTQPSWLSASQHGAWRPLPSAAEWPRQSSTPRASPSVPPPKSPPRRELQNHRARPATSRSPVRARMRRSRHFKYIGGTRMSRRASRRCRRIPWT